MFTVAPAPAGGLPSADSVQVPDTSVVALVVTAGGMHHRLHTGLMSTLLTDLEYGWGNFKGEKIHTSGANISKERNTIVRRFLDETDAEWAWLIDSDMVIDGTTLPRLLCAAAVSGAKIIGGLCCMIGADGPIPTIYQLGDPSQNEVTRIMLDYPDNTVIQVAATGTACLLVHRSVLEAMRDAEPELTYPWFREEEHLGQWVSEDIGFTLRANRLGFPVFVDCLTHIGHAKGREIWWPSDIRSERGFPANKNYAVIPSKTRELAEATVAQLAGQPLERVVVLDNTPDGSLADLDALVIPMPDAGIHEMWNTGIAWCIEDSKQRRNVNILVLNDDLRFDGTFVAEMVRGLRSDRNMVAVSGNYDGRPGRGVQFVDDICAGRYDGSGGFAGFAFAITGEWCQSGYKFPEECKWWFGDNDLIMAVRTSEIGKVGIVLAADVAHIDGGSQTGGDWSAYMAQIKKDEAAYNARWQRLTGQPTQSAGKQVTVLSSIYGGYDQPCPLVLQNGVTAYLIDTDCETVPAPWRKLPPGRFDSFVVDAHGPRYRAKFAKYQPFQYTDADFVVWLDGRVQTVKPGFVSWLIDSLGDADIALYRHPMGRSSILAEAEAALVENPAKYAGHDLVGQAKSYLVDGYEDVNLWQTTFYVARRNERTVELGRRWQEEQDKYPDCLLDQIPFAPLVAECGVNVADLPGGFWDRHGDLFVLRPHVDGT